MPLYSRLLGQDDFMTLVGRGDGVNTRNVGAEVFVAVVNGGISLVLVLLGGFFAGLTLAYVGLFA
jgi:hypothetical protein